MRSSAFLASPELWPPVRTLRPPRWYPPSTHSPECPRRIRGPGPALLSPLSFDRSLIRGGALCPGLLGSRAGGTLLQGARAGEEGKEQRLKGVRHLTAGEQAPSFVMMMTCPK